MGSSTSLSDAWTTRSARVAIPSLRSFPFFFGIITCRTSDGRYSPAFSWSRICSRKPLTPPSRFSTAATVTASMPGVRAPLFPLTRIHASARKSGSQTRLNRSPNRREQSFPAQRCSLACIPRTLPSTTGSSSPGSPEKSPSGQLSRAPGFPGASSGITSTSFYLAYCAAHCRPSPCGRLSRPRSTTAAPPRPRLRPASRLSAPCLPGREAGRNGHGRFPRSLLSGRRARHPALPLRHRHGYAAAFHRGLPSQAGQTRTGVPRPVMMGRVRAADQPESTGFRAGGTLRGVTAPVPRVYLPASLTAPGPSGSTRPARLCQGCSRPPRRPPGRTALSFTPPLRRQRDGGLSPPSETAAPRGARPAVPGGPGGDLAAVQAGDLLGHLVIFLDFPAGDGHVDQLGQRDGLRAPAQVVADGAGVAVAAQEQERVPVIVPAGGVVGRGLDHRPVIVLGALGGRAGAHPLPHGRLDQVPGRLHGEAAAGRHGHHLVRADSHDIARPELADAPAQVEGPVDFIAGDERGADAAVMRLLQQLAGQVGLGREHDLVRYPGQLTALP